MYYKDVYIEFKLGLGIMSIRSLTAEVYSLALIREVESNIYQPFTDFTSDSTTLTYPPDGNYRLRVTNNNNLDYYVYLTVNDAFISEFVKQVELIVCKCSCDDDTDTPCGGSKKNSFCLKRQRLFNMMSILPYTIKPFTKGETAKTNPYLFKFFQLYFNDIVAEKRIELGQEYSSYFLNGTTNISTKLFNSLVINLYYSLYYYSKLFLTTDATVVDKTNYINIVGNFFKYGSLRDCFKCNSIEKDIETIMVDVIADPCFCSTNVPAELPATIMARDVVYLVPKNIESPSVVFNVDLDIDTVLDLLLVFGVQPKFVTITNISDTDNLVKKGLNNLNNIVQLTEKIPNNSIPLTINKTVPQSEDYSYTAVLSCYVTDNFGRVSNNFSITLLLTHVAVPITEELYVTINNGTENKTTLDYKREVVYMSIGSIGSGTVLTNVVWSIIDVEQSYDGGIPFNTDYEVLASVGGASASFTNLTPGYKYTVQLYALNDVAQESFFQMVLEVLG